MFKKLLAMVVAGVAATIGASQCETPQPVAQAPVIVRGEALNWPIGFQPAKQPAVEEQATKHATGRKNPTAEVLAKRHADALKRIGKRMSALPTATPATFDCRALGWVGPVLNQGNCGLCWGVAGADCATSGFIKAGLAPSDGTFELSAQYFLDQCAYPNAGCNGDDSVNVLDWLYKNGGPTTGDYGPYTAVQGRCRYNGQALKKLSNWGYCTPAQQSGMAATQDIKNAMVLYGPISTAIAANSDWDNYRSGVMPYRKLSPNQVNHDVQLAGWDDTKKVPNSASLGAWLMKNQWDTTWGENGYAWIPYGSHQVGTEAAWLTVTPPAPTPTPDPTPTPTPIPTGTTSATVIYGNDAIVIDPVKKTVTYPSTWNTPGGPNGAAQLEALRVKLGMERLRWRLLIGDVIGAKLRGASDADLDAIRLRFNLTPEQWQLIIQLILQLLPLFIGDVDPVGYGLPLDRWVIDLLYTLAA